ncbi:MAG TPA: hypothetical protein VF791_21475 [Pyrinomonadaceae bacterium]
MGDSTTPSFGTIGIVLVILGILVIVIPIILYIRERRKENEKGFARGSIEATVRGVDQPKELPATFVKRCPTCKAIYADETLAFCLSDGSTLERIPNPSPPADPNATAIYVNANQSDPPPTVRYHPGRSSGNKG